MQDDVLRIIESHLHHTPLELIRKEIGDDDIEQVIEAIVKHQPKLRALHLDNNKLSDQGAQKLAQHLCDLHDLTLLSLQFNQIDTAGAKLIYSVRDKLTELEILFRGNKIKNAGIMHEIEQPPGPSFRY